MEFDLHLLLDILEFLRTLKDAPLPAMLETSRGNLLGRVQIALSPGDNYIDMKPGKQLQKPPVKSQPVPEESSSTPTTSSFLYNHRSKAFAESPQKESQSKPLQPSPNNGPTLLHECGGSSASVSSVLEPRVAATDVDSPSENLVVNRKTKAEEEMEESLVEVYTTMSFTQVKDKCYKFGELQRRERRIIFDNIRSFWAVVIGSHFLSYDSKNDTKPSLVLPLKGSTCQLANQVPRSVKKFADSTFDICLEDCRVFQFIASTPKEMEEWMAVVIQPQKFKVGTEQQPVSRNPTGVTKSESLAKSRNISRKEYDKIPDIVGALRDSIEQPPVPGAKILPKAQNKPSGIHTLSTKPPTVVPKRMLRDLPPPPVETEPDDEADAFYNEIENPQGNRRAGKPERYSAIPYEEEEQDDEDYDDVGNVKQQMLLLGLKSNRGAGEETLVQSCVDDEQGTYDDVDDVKHQVQMLREADALANAKTEACAKETPSPKVPPKLPIRGATLKDKFVQNSVNDEQETYDDVAEVKNEVQILREAEAAKAKACEKERRITKVPPKVPTRGGTAEEKLAQSSVIDEQETYDDVADVKNEVQILREAEAAAKEKANANAKLEACEKEKRTIKVPPKTPTKVSPIKSLIDKMRNRNESSQKEVEVKKQAADTSPPGQRETPTEIQSVEDVKEPDESYPNNQLLDQSNYNTPRTPRPVHPGKRLGVSMREEEEEEEFYDDILEGTKFGNCIIGRDSDSEKLKRNDVVLAKKYTMIPDVVNDGSSRGPRKAVKNLSKSFEGEIYENQPSNKIVRGGSKFHQTKKITNTNLHPSAATTNVRNEDEQEEVYDDVQLVAQKTRAIEESKKNLAVQSPPKNSRVLFATKSLFADNKSKAEKQALIENRHEADNIYDDCAPK